MSTSKNWWQSKSIHFAVAISVLGVIEQNSAIIPEAYRGYALIAIGIVSACLRVITTRPIVANGETV